MINNDNLLFEDITLEQTCKKACKELNCSLLNLDYKIVQNYSNGFLGLFKKNSIIKVNIKTNNKNIINEIKLKINDLFSKLCLQIDEIQVSYYDEETIYVKFDGQDSSLLIGKEAYRYKAISYILFNWIYDKYKLNIKLEIADYLKFKEEKINKYLQQAVIPKVYKYGFSKTKYLDKVIINVALNNLRKEFPNKYIAIKTNHKSEKYIIINEYKKHD